MEIDFSEISYLKDPDEQTLKADYQQFLLSLTGPTVIDITGINTSKCRVITTLLHGNEPSGLIAIHRWLTCQTDNKIAQTNIRFIICSIEAASKTPLFSNRYLANGIDINRCFGANKTKEYFQRASLIEHAIGEVSPEAVIDLHNTPGTGPAFSVSPVITTDVLSLASFFCKTIILSDIRLGALMELDFGCPIITIECGGCQDEQAHEVAFAGINHIAQCQTVDYIHQEKSVEVIYRPLRLQLKPGVELCYAEHDIGQEGVTLKSSIENYNFGSADTGEMFGWLDSHGLENLQLLDTNKNNVIDEYFTTRDNQLVCATNIRIFMATTTQIIASNDCLFYVVKDPVGDI